MSRKIGETLVQQGLINGDQLKTALQAQLAHGGTLGTCLIELEYIDEESLAITLSQILGVPHVSPGQLHSIPAAVIQKIPMRLAEKHRAVPFRLEPTCIHVAMVDPRDLHALDELSCAAGCRVEAAVCPEVRLVRVLETYYGIPRSPRFLVLTSVEEQLKSTGRGLPVSQTRAPGAGPRVVRAPVVPLLDIDATDHDRPAAATVAPPAEGPAGLHEAVARIDDRMCEAEDKEALAAATLDCAELGLPRCILFYVEYYCARIWDWRSLGLVADCQKKIAFRLTEEPLFELLAGDDYYRGELPQEPRFQGFYTTLDVEIPQEILLVPVHISDRLVAILYGDGGPDGAIEGDTVDYRRLMRKLQLAIQIVATKRRLRQA